MKNGNLAHLFADEAGGQLSITFFDLNRRTAWIASPAQLRRQRLLRIIHGCAQPLIMAGPARSAIACDRLTLAAIDRDRQHHL